MITLKIKIKTDGKKTEELHFLTDDYNICKQNKDLLELVATAVKNANFEKVEEVKLIATMEW